MTWYKEEQAHPQPAEPVRELTALELAAQAWCYPATRHTLMDNDLCEAFADILQADRALRAPDGWVMVPIEPTEEMTSAIRQVTERRSTEPFSWGGYAIGIYRAMIAAAPKQGEQT